MIRSSRGGNVWGVVGDDENEQEREEVSDRDAIKDNDATDDDSDGNDVRLLFTRTRVLKRYGIEQCWSCS